MNIITPAQVVEYAFTHREAISPHSIRRSKIDVVAERFVRPRFGDNLYEKFLSGDYAPFVDEYLKPAIAHYVRYAMVDELSIQMTDSGAMLFESQETESQRFKTVAAEVNEKNSSTQNQTTDSQQEVDSVKTIDSTLHTTTNTTLERQNVQHDNARTTLAAASEDTLTRDSTATTHDDRLPVEPKTSRQMTPQRQRQTIRVTTTITKPRKLWA